MTVLPRPALEISPHALPVHPAPLHLGFLSPHNALDRRSFSGTAFHAAAALAAHRDIQLHLIGPHHRKPKRTDRLFYRNPPAPHITANDLTGLDVVVGLVATGLLDQLHQISTIPTLHITDATPQFLRDTYGWDIPSEADDIEARVTQQAVISLYSSRYMAQRACRELSIPPRKSGYAPFGVNLTSSPETCATKPPLEVLELLFVGTNWARKGGDIALAAVAHLTASGQPCRLHVVGRLPDHLRGHPDVCAHGFLDKNRPRDRTRLARLYEQSHLLILPTRGDCTPMVIGEAMAFGTPVLAADTGGIREMVGTQGAGLVLAQTAAPADWARTIAQLCRSPQALETASWAAFQQTRTQFSWTRWADQVVAETQDCLSAPAPQNFVRRVA